MAADRAYDQTKTVLPAEMARGTYMQNVPGLAALKLMHLMIGTAGGRMADDVRHQMRLSDIRAIAGMKHHDRASLTPLFAELAAAVLICDDKDKQTVTIGGLVDEAHIDYRHEVSGDLLVTWTFRSMFKRMAEESNHWAILDRQTVFHLSSKYAVMLFQHVASLSNLERINSKTFTIAELRTILGVAEGKHKRFAELNRWTIKPAIAEINQLSRLNLTATPNKIGRTVASVTIGWETKEDPAEAKREMAHSKVGRKARRDGTAEMPALSFPATGSVKYTKPWEEIARAKCNWDHAKLADAFRSFCQQRRIKLDAKNIEKVFTDFCAKQPRI